MTEQVQNNSLGRRAWRKLATQKFTMACFFVIVLYLVVALIGALDWLPDHRVEIGDSYTKPNWSLAGILGTDFFGYSVLPLTSEGGWYQGNGLMLLAPSAFFLIGVFIWVLRTFKPDQVEKD